MKCHQAAILILMAGYAMSSEQDNDDIEELGVAIFAAIGVSQLVGGHGDGEVAQMAEQEFLESDDTEWWECDDAFRFRRNRGCGEDGCPVTLAANHSMGLGKVTFAGVQSYAQYGVQGLERQWHWCLQDDDRFDCTFTLSAGGDGTYYDFKAPSTNIRSDGREIAKPAGRFTCERSGNGASDIGIGTGGIGDFPGDEEYLPIVKVAPIYPRRALIRKIEGYVLLEFVVTSTGSVEDPVVVEADPPGYFERAAIQAALKFKYKPKVIDGEPVAVSGVRNRIVFEMSSGQKR